MFDLATLALRNTLRNTRRSLITVVSIAVGCAAMVLFAGFITFTFEGLRETTIRTQLGHVQIYAEGYTEKRVSDPASVMLRDPAGLVAALADIEGVQVVTERLSLSGIGGTGNATLSMQVIGIDPAREVDFADFEITVEGRNMEPGDEDVGVIGEELQAGLNAEIGDWVTVLTTSLDGVINTFDFRLVGVVRTGAKAWDTVYVKVPIGLTRQVLETDAAERLIVLLEDTAQLPQAEAEVRRVLAEQGGGYELKLWYELAEFYEAVVALYSGMFRVFAAIVAIVVMFSVANTMTMAVFERQGEMGALRAIGAPRLKLVQMVLIEGTLIGLFGAIAGLALAALIAWGVALTGGIPMPPPPSMSEGYQAFFQITSQTVLQALLLGTLAAALSSLYPAIVASRTNIVEALQK
jgi:putative ABC transport system permease protein